MLEAIFTLRDDGTETMGKRKRKWTREQWAAHEAYQADLDRRLREMIEKYRRLNEARRAS